MRVGIIGGGQLGKMLAMAAMRLNVQCSFWLDGALDHTLSEWGRVYSGTVNDRDAFTHFLREIDVLTYEYEHVPLNYLELAQSHLPVYPAMNALAIMQDRLFEKQLFQRLGIRCAPYVPVNNHDELQQAGQQLGFPFILKTRRAGYDGKGQYRFHQQSQLLDFVLPDAVGGYVAEAFVPFSAEVSLVAARSMQGEIAFYPLTENTHENGILLHSRPVPTHAYFAAACKEVRAILTELNYVGVFTLEYFIDGLGLVANEMAPRVHNSTHWSIEGAVTSQFENHIRAISGWPIGSTRCVAPVMMCNVLGMWPAWPALFSLQNVCVHHYGKSNRPGRKLGHVTAYLPNFERDHAEQQWIKIKNALQVR